ncbi:hypothetical protein Desca_0784 [Desulfotomaculum nigrificans CO-1-SRB]|uniref:Uncharacterized protein n=1 Tax=Desulfotomaculum nigrificans (strain DSM 14880 / VKM B-2319 / CO-1-SRB) TaxID=868595 RepID=F6B913_DESCC|nr:hypothetical protein [Desulfotomaculum nigrificans]AEF93664.1 hypothetical protein Desca_0784 [Desulfotomaculum nigrificans CO-1-SRB]
MTKVEELAKEIEQLTLKEQKALFDLLADTLDTLGWFKLNDIVFYGEGED